MRESMVIAIDGPAASGKSTVAQRVAARLHYLYFDTGVMYRAVTLAVIQQQVDVNNQKAVEQIAMATQINVTPPSIEDGRQYDVVLNGVDVTWQIRSNEIEANVSLVSTYPGVRQAMTERQREIGLQGRVVMVGRDIGTVVMPDADIKFYLDASVQERARRRYTECMQHDMQTTYESILAAMQSRDHIDSTREIAPLRKAADAIYLNTSDLSIDMVVDQVIQQLVLTE